MSPSALGKRTRVDGEFRKCRTERTLYQHATLGINHTAVAIETPTKKARHYNAYPLGREDNQENNDPRSTSGAHGTIKIEVEAAADAPRKRRRSESQTPVKKIPVTPSTPRHRDVLSGYPTTPRHAVMSAGKLFKRLTPSSPLSPSTIQTVYHTARQLFARGAEPRPARRARFRAS